MPDPQQQMTIDESGAMNQQDVQAKLKALLDNISKQVNTQSSAAPQGGPGAVAAQMAGPGGSAQQGGSVTMPGQLPTPGPQAPGGRPNASASPMTPMPATASPMNAPVGQYVPHSQREPRQYEFDTKKGAKTATVYDTVNAMSEILNNVEKKNQAKKTQGAEALYTQFKNYYDQGNMEAAAFLFSDENKNGKKNRKMVQDVMGGIPEMPPEGMAFQKAHEKLQQGGQGQQPQGQPQQGQGQAPQGQQPQPQAKPGQQPQQGQYSQAALQQWFQQQALQKQATQLQGSIATAQQAGNMAQAKSSGESQGALPADLAKIEATGKQSSNIQGQSDTAAMARLLEQNKNKIEVTQMENGVQMIQNPSKLATSEEFAWLKPYTDPMSVTTFKGLIDDHTRMAVAKLNDTSKITAEKMRDGAIEKAAQYRATAEAGKNASEPEWVVKGKVDNILTSPTPNKTYKEMMSGMNTPTRQAIDAEFIGRGIKLGSDMDVSIVKAAQQAQQTIPEMDKWINKMSDPQVAAEFGLIKGRWSQFMAASPEGLRDFLQHAGFTGNVDDFIGLRTYLEGLKQSMPFKSGGMAMGGPALVKRLDDILNATTMQPDVVAKSLSEIKATMQSRVDPILKNAATQSAQQAPQQNTQQQPKVIVVTPEDMK